VKVTQPGPCWVIEDADGSPWDDEASPHYDTEAEAAASASDLREDYASDRTPEEEAAALVDSAPPGYIGDTHEARYARALASFQKQAARLASLHPVALGEPCHQIRCDGPGCDAEPETDEFAHVHYSERYPFDPGDHDWTGADADGKHYCEDCTIKHLCVECGGPMGEGADLDERMCAKCVSDEARDPGPTDVPLPIGGVL
jgi:hypothetical protein